MRTFITQDPFLPLNADKPWRERGLWPARWITCPGATPPFVAAFRLRFSSGEESVRIHVTADERYELYLDGVRLGRGPERVSPERWYYETYELSLAPGEHTLVARAWALGELAADAQMSAEPGFLLAAEGPWTKALSTGLAAWECKLLDGYTYVQSPVSHWRGANVQMDGARYPWGVENGAGDGWQPAGTSAHGIGKHIDWSLRRPAHELTPATLPPMLDQPVPPARVRYVGDARDGFVTAAHIEESKSLAAEIPAWQALLDGNSSLIIPPHTRRRAILDLNNYYLAYSELVTSNGKGSRLSLRWAEALFETNDIWGSRKGHRDQLDGKYFIGQGDTFLPDGSLTRSFTPLWWSAGRYIEVVVETADQPLIIERFTLHETRYPLEMESDFSASDPRLQATIPLLARGLQMCANETYFDCPYYEELQYGGDMRLEALVNYVMSRDDRLARKAIDIFDASRLWHGLTQARYPCRETQLIPAWTLWWVAMVRDYAYWRCDLDFVRQVMPGVRASIEGFRRWIGQDGLLHAPDGWNTFDWVPAWDAGCPPDAVSGVSGVLNWHLIYTLMQYNDLEERLNETLLAERACWQAMQLAKNAIAAFWDEERGLLADDLAHQHFSEHTQCLALLSDLLDRPMRDRIANGLLTDPNLDRMTVYASHYLFEAYRKLGRIDALFDRLPLWFDLVSNGFKTGVEKPEPSRSDCHGWSSHPLYHYFASILGIRPGDLGFCSVEIIPQLGPLEHACGRLVHPAGGEIVLEVCRAGDLLHGKIELPPGVDAMLHVNGETLFFKEETKEF
jgi:hypothetical protein